MRPAINSLVNNNNNKIAMLLSDDQNGPSLDKGLCLVCDHPTNNIVVVQHVMNSNPNSEGYGHASKKP